MKLDFRFLNKLDGSKVLQVRAGQYTTIKSKKWWKPWDIDVEFNWSDWHTVREEFEKQDKENGY
jgi:hypothetical protein